jgi:hypothetical protein
MAIVEATFDVAITGHAEHQVDRAAGSHRRADQRAASTSQVLGDATGGVAIDGPADVVSRMEVRRPDAENVDGPDVAGHAEASAVA